MVRDCLLGIRSYPLSGRSTIRHLWTRWVGVCTSPVSQAPTWRVCLGSPSGKSLIQTSDLGSMPPGYHEGSRREWVVANRLRTQTGRCAAMLYKWGKRDSPRCPNCQSGSQTMGHMALRCEKTKIEGGFASVHAFTPEFRDWVKVHGGSL